MKIKFSPSPVKLLFKILVSLELLITITLDEPLTVKTLLNKVVDEALSNLIRFSPLNELFTR